MTPTTNDLVIELNDINIRIAVLGRIIDEARADGDERWVVPAAQARELSTRRHQVLTRLRERGVLPTPSEVVVRTRIASTAAEVHNGSR